MRRFTLFLLTAALALSSFAGNVLADSFSVETDPLDGIVAGAPGSTVGWGFTFTATDSNYYVLDLVEFCYGAQTQPCPTDTAAGTFTDIAAGINGLIIGPGESESPYTEGFSPGTSGLGEFDIAPDAAAQQLVGTIDVHYDVYEGDPTINGTELLSDQQISTSAEVNIASSAPEPGSIALSGLGLVWLLLRRRRTQHIPNRATHRRKKFLQLRRLLDIPRPVNRRPVLIAVRAR